jgi:uncharacterized protein (UPF0332 family)
MSNEDGLIARRSLLVATAFPICSKVRPGSDKLLAKAERAADNAAVALEQGAGDLAAARAFAAMLNAAKALLNERGARLRTHARIAAALAALPAVDGAPADWLAEALAARRRLADHGELDYAAIERLVERARGFVAAAAREIRYGRSPAPAS